MNDSSSSNNTKKINFCQEEMERAGGIIKEDVVCLNVLLS